MKKRQKKLAVINDFCGFGRCSLTVSIPIISAMKIECCPLPTAVFSNHTGYESFYKADLTSHLENYINEWKKLNLEFEGILSGFLSSPLQIEIVKSFFENFKKDNTLIVIDPVMGDGGQLYSSYSPLLAEKMSSLLPYADVLTPNLTEACILSGYEYREDIDEKGLLKICEALSQKGPERIVISGLERGEDLENFVFEKGKKPLTIREHKAGPCRAGTGDVFASIIASDMVNGKDLEFAVRHASAFIAKVLRRTGELEIPKTDGICFEEFLGEINE